MIEIINFEDRPSLVNVYMAELRDVRIQADPLRFRTNLERIGQIMAYEISHRLEYVESDVPRHRPLPSSRPGTRARHNHARRNTIPPGLPELLRLR